MSETNNTRITNEITTSPGCLWVIVLFLLFGSCGGIQSTLNDIHWDLKNIHNDLKALKNTDESKNK